ncbi:predicted protein [Uncinocarpus reesii 1704]|uniref:Uncharacterized protein n=1 Tax=Uncinocarpus reesii (strain UAMH 1704) TaxID=336963 RepID=C4JP46_UNCRE|nr:uncharacterized protein UREG_03105 [Uncinocarpus reesii 1704]EEP78260.1 predicted protein [Uncinocarpus reesii 1704]
MVLPKAMQDFPMNTSQHNTIKGDDAGRISESDEGEEARAWWTNGGVPSVSSFSHSDRIVKGEKDGRTCKEGKGFQKMKAEHENWCIYFHWFDSVQALRVSVAKLEH